LILKSLNPLKIKQKYTYSHIVTQNSFQRRDECGSRID